MLRFAVEALFLVALAGGLAFADWRPLVIAGVMALGWLIVGLLELATSREEPHYGSGLPPRFYVPQVSLPPPRPLEQVGSGYPAAEQRDEAPTWIAPPALRAEVLGEWPVAPRSNAGEDTQADDAPPELEEHALETQPEDTAVPSEPEPVVPEPVPEAEPEEEVDGPELEPAAAAGPRRRRLWGRRGRDDASDDADPWVVAELPVAPEEFEPAADTAVVALVEVEAAVPDDVETNGGPTARHTLDPLAEDERKRLWRRRRRDEGGVVDVPARPPGPRPLPGRSTRED
jgi:hypothetical protein